MQFKEIAFFLDKFYVFIVEEASCASNEGVYLILALEFLPGVC